MKRILFYFLVLLVAVWIGVTIHNNPGYVLLSYKDWTIETSLWFAVFGMLALFATLFLLLRLGGGVGGIAVRIHSYFNNRRQRKARKRTNAGLYDLAEGNWKSAEYNLIKAASFSDMPLINYLAAALMAQKQSAYERAENYLRQAQKIQSKHPFAVGLTQARLQMTNKKWEEAFATLQHLHQENPKNKLILELLCKVCLEINEWFTLRDLIPKLRKRHVLDYTKINTLEQKVWFELLKKSTQEGRIEIMWNQMPRYLKTRQDLLNVYCSHLVLQNKHEDAEALIKLSLRKNLDKNLLDLYSSLRSDKPLKKLARAESWLKSSPQNAGLLLCLGKICKNLKLWGKARNYLEQSAKIEPTPSVYFDLGQIMEAQKNIDLAMEFYKKGLTLK